VTVMGVGRQSEVTSNYSNASTNVAGWQQHNTGDDNNSNRRTNINDFNSEQFCDKWVWRWWRIYRKWKNWKFWRFWKKINFVDEQQEQQLEEDQEHVGHEVNKVSIEGDKENDASYVENNSKIINQNFLKKLFQPMKTRNLN